MTRVVAWCAVLAFGYGVYTWGKDVKLNPFAGMPTPSSPVLSNLPAMPAGCAEKAC